MVLGSTQPLTEMSTSGRLRLKCDGTRAETRFRLSAKRTSPFKIGEGLQFSRLLEAEVCASAVVMLDTPCSEVVWRVLATHCIRQFPFTSPPCVTVYHHISVGFYLPGMGKRGGRCVGLTMLPLLCADCLYTLWTSASWKAKGLSRPVNG
jgi:hypothetical protein